MNRKTIKFEEVNRNGVEKPQVTETSNYLPIEFLPSKYRYYDTENKIFARPLNVLEVKLLASMDLNNYDFIINDILKRTTKGIEIENIFESDKFFIIFWLRANTYKNSGYELDFQCKHCEKNSKYNFNVDVLDVGYLDDGVNINEEKILPHSKDRIVIKFKRIKDGNKIREFIKRTKNGITKYDEEILEVSSNIDKINGEELSIVNKYEYIEKMHPVDFAYLISYIDSITFGVKNQVNAVCNVCKETTPIGVTFRSEFFIPKYNI